MKVKFMDEKGNMVLENGTMLTPSSKKAMFFKLNAMAPRYEYMYKMHYNKILIENEILEINNYYGDVLVLLKNGNVVLFNENDTYSSKIIYENVKSVFTAESCQATMFLLNNNELVMKGKHRYLKANYDKYTSIFKNVKKVILHEKMIIVVTNDNYMYMADVNHYDELTKIENVIAVSDVVSYSDGKSCAVLQSNGDVKVYGNNKYGQLGDKSADKKIFTQMFSDIKRIFAFNTSLITVSSDNKIHYYGEHNSTCYGVNSNTMYFDPVTSIKKLISYKNIRENNIAILQDDGTWCLRMLAQENNSGYLFYKMDIKDVVAVAPLTTCTLFLDSNKKVYYQGEFPYKHNQYAGRPHDHSLYPLELNEIVPVNSVINDFDKLIQLNNKSSNNISVNQMVIYLKDDGTIMTCGKNDFGQLGLNDTKDRNVLTKVPGINGVSQVSCGDSHAMILYNDGTIATCGNNRFGQLGLGNNTDKTVFTKVPGIKDVVQISCGGNSSTIKLANGSILVCGDNARGQLCLGDNKNRNIFTKVNNI